MSKLRRIVLTEKDHMNLLATLLDAEKSSVNMEEFLDGVISRLDESEMGPAQFLEAGTSLGLMVTTQREHTEDIRQLITVVEGAGTEV